MKKTDGGVLKKPIIRQLAENIAEIKELSGGTSDLLVNEFETGGVKCALLCCEGMFSSSTIAELVLEHLKVEALLYSVCVD